VDHRVQVLVGGAEPLQNPAQRITIRAKRLGPTGGKLDAGDGIVSAAYSNALTPTVAIVALVLPVASVAALICAHGAQLYLTGPFAG
jgi:hypothetical protein